MRLRCVVLHFLHHREKAIAIDLRNQRQAVVDLIHRADRRRKPKHALEIVVKRDGARMPIHLKHHFVGQLGNDSIALCALAKQSLVPFKFSYGSLLMHKCLNRHGHANGQHCDQHAD
ncbi:hypothetical protein SDC9_188119 [bioreactor metagenome]|uniref:Uncharacterized protein n=1 Tax=bioreactor metagenome TaxID=1076179 RepID=A0A645HNF0_9ZZZZ